MRGRGLGEIGCEERGAAFIDQPGVRTGQEQENHAGHQQPERYRDCRTHHDSKENNQWAHRLACYAEIALEQAAARP